MKMLKVFFALLLLLLGSNAIAFSPTVKSTALIQEDTLHTEVAETVTYVYESTLVFSFTLQKISYLVSTPVQSFRFSSDQESTSGGSYVKRSKYIDPGLNIPDIIFPFHNFL